MELRRQEIKYNNGVYEVDEGEKEGEQNHEVKVESF